MSSASSPRGSAGAGPEIARLSNDPADDDANAAPTKVGPMSKAFVDQMMFKAQIAEATPPSRPPVAKPPTSGELSRAASGAAPSASAAPAPRTAPAKRADANPVVLHEEDDGLPFEPTVLADAAPAPTVSAQPFLRNLAGRTVRLPAPAFPAPPPAWPAFSGAADPWIAEFALSGASRAKRERKAALEVFVLLSGLALIVTAVVLRLFS